MIKIGKAYFDEDLRWGIVPSMSYNEEDGKYLVILQNGVKVSVAASAPMVDAAMERLGYTTDSDPALSEILTAEEQEELAPYFRQGWAWLAKDGRGFTYVFAGEPQKVGVYWEDPDEGQSSRLLEDYAFLGKGEKICLTGGDDND